MSSLEDTHSDHVAGGERHIIVILAPASASYQGLARAIEARHLGLKVLFADADSLDNIGPADTRLVLTLVNSDRPLDPALVACQRHFPSCPVGVIVEDTSQNLSAMEAAFSVRQISGLLPLDLTLDIWLAAIMLLVSGGEYYPPHMPGRPGPAGANWTSAVRNGSTVSDTRDAPATLTSREREVLQLVSEGYQNKLIADRMSLSEHTVKVHVHNVITKLRVSNRTQAAAAYRQSAGEQRPVQGGQW